jgi:hypothetical protein
MRRIPEAQAQQEGERLNMKLTHISLKYAVIIVWLHTFIAVVHGLSHIANGVELPIFGNAFVIVVIVLAPLLALLLLHTRWQRPGALLLALAMLTSLLFGLLNHFLVPGPDNAAQVMPGMWHSSFLVTSILIALSEAVGTAIGVWCLSALTWSHAQHGQRDGKSFSRISEKSKI